MRSLRKLITAVLALAMILTSVGITAFAAEFSDITDEKVAAAVSKLVAYNIITGYEDGTFKPDNQITRAEFAAIVTRMKGVAGNLPQDSVTGFSDLDNDSSRAWARPYVKAAVDLKIINGFEDGTFRAAEPVTYEQAVKMLICAIGYDVVAQSEYKKAVALNPAATWSAGYIAAANKHGVTKGVITAMISEPASRGVVAVLTSNALEVPELVQGDDGNYFKPDEGSGSSESTMKTITGVITGTFYTGLEEASLGISKNEIVIDATEDEYDRTYTLSSSLAESIDVDEYIGRRVNAYYDNIDGEITSIKITGSSSEIIDEASIESISGKTVKYRDENGKVSSESLDNYTFIVNGKYVEDYDLNSNFTNGTIELFSSGSYKIAKINSYNVFVVNSYDKSNEKIFLKYANYNGNNYYEFPTRQSEKPVIYVSSSGSSKYTLTQFESLSLSQYDVINYLESPEGTAGDPLRKMYVTKGSKSGKITATLDGEREIELDDKSLYLTQQYYNFTGNSTDEKAPFELSDTYTYYLDYTGQIAAVKYSAATSTGSWAYGYLIEVDTKTDQVGILNSSGSYKAYDLKDTVLVDGVKCKSSEVFDALTESAAIIDENATSEAVLNGYAQPLRYSMSGGKIDSLDTVIESKGGSNDNFTYDGMLGEAGSTSTTKVTASGESFAVNSSTLVIYVPNNRTDDDAYAVMKPSAAFAVTKDRLVEVFAVDATSSNKLAKVVTVYGTNPSLAFTGNSPYMIVSKIRNVGDTQMLEGYDKNSSDSTMSVKISEDNFETSITGSNSLVTGSDVEVGDVIRYIKDNSGDVVAIEMVYDASEGGKLSVSDKNADGTVYTHTEGTGTDFLVRYGTANAKDSTDNTIDILCNGESKTHKTGSTKFFKLTSSGDVTTSVIDEISIESDGGEPSTIVLISGSKVDGSTAALIYIIE